jgi:type IV pilus assembly protein PilE
MIEVMIVVIIVGVLAAVAVPTYQRSVRNSRVSEATTRMADILTAAKTYAAQNSDPRRPVQWPPSCSVSGFLGNCQSSANFRYSLARAGGTLTIFAIGTGRMRNCQVIMTVRGIDSNGQISVRWGVLAS